MIIFCITLLIVMITILSFICFSQNKQIKTLSQIQIQKSHHRTQNALQIISSLFNHNNRSAGAAPEEANLFRHFERQIVALGLLHRNISGAESEVDFTSFLRTYCHHFNFSVTAAAPLCLAEDIGIPLGILVGEMIYNEFPTHDNADILDTKISLALTDSDILIRIENSRISETYANGDKDDGAGPSTLIRDLASQIGATLTYMGDADAAPARAIRLARR